MAYFCLFQPGRTRWEDLPTMVSPVSLDSIPDVQVSEAVKCEEHGESTKVSAEQQSLSEVTEEQQTGMSYIIERLQTAISKIHPKIVIPSLTSKMCFLQKFVKLKMNSFSLFSFLIVIERSLFLFNKPLFKIICSNFLTKITCYIHDKNIGQGFL